MSSMIRKALLFPYTFSLLNLAAVAGLYHFCRKTGASEIWVERRVNVFSPPAAN
jgi:hypothetical protein